MRPVGFVERWNKRLLAPVARALARIPWLHPDHLTLLSAAAGGMAAPLLLVAGHPWLAALFLWLGAWLDSLDGDLARLKGCASPAGALLDAVLDRYVDLAMLVALIEAAPEAWRWLGYLAITGSVLTPYVRARAEAGGLPAAATIGSRDVRMLIITAGLLLEAYAATLVAVACIANFSALHRILAARRAA